MDQGERQLLIEVSILYYLEGKTQSEIAKQLFISRPKVSRLLKRSRELNIVDIKINYHSDELEYLQSEIMRNFNIPKVIAVRSLEKNEDTLREIGKAGAFELIDKIKEGMTIGISWGRSVRNTVNQLPSKPIKDLKIVELFGAFSYDMDDTDMLSIGNVIASKLSGRFFPLPAPIYMPDKQTREILIGNPVIKQSLNMIKNCDLILTGIGAIDSRIPAVLWDVYVEDNMQSQIKAQGGVGFLCAHFFDGQGRFLDLDVNDNVIGIQTDDIESHKNILLVAGGPSKAKAIYAALKGGYINTLVSDHETLETILELNQKSKKR